MLIQSEYLCPSVYVLKPDLPNNDIRRWGLQKLIRSLGEAFMNGN